MAHLVLSVSQILLSTIARAMELWENKKGNVELRNELKQFIQDLQGNIDDLRSKCISARCSNSAGVALDALQMDLQSAVVEAKTILKEGFIRSLWDANKTLAQLQTLHKRVMTSFQTKLTIATLDVVIETQQELDSFRESMLKVNGQLLELYSTNSGSVGRLESIIREELKKALQPVLLSLQKSTEEVEAVVSMIRNTNPQTSETEKFFADVLEGLRHVTEHSNSTASETRNMSQLQWHQDPITWDTMCDPVKATDGYTYDRWTFLRHASSMTCSPFLGDIQSPFNIAMDDLSVRSRLFHEFPEQEERCRVERAAYKDEALQAAHLERLGEALIMLNNVLMWNPQDEECRSKKDDIQRKIAANSITGTSLQVTSSRSHTPAANPTVVREQSAAALQVVSKFELEEPSYIGECENAILSPDGLTATYMEHNSSSVLCANRPCPPDGYPFYYFEMIVEPPVVRSKDDPKRADVALGFSCTKEMSESSDHLPLGMYPGSCGYYSLSGEIYYYDKGSTQVVSLEGDPFQEGDIVGAGFHYRTGNVFFTRLGEVVAFVRAAILEHPVGSVFPSVSLQSYGARVKLNFGHSPDKFSEEPYPSHLDRSTCDESHLVLAPNGLSLKTKKNSGTFRAILADKPVPARTTFFYFEVDITDFPVSSDGSIAIGFTGVDGFQQEGSPGYWKNSCGYQSDSSESCIRLPQGTPLKAKSPASWRLGWHDALAGDRIGAGIHYDSNEIFFVKNGLFIGAVGNSLIGKVMPALAVRNNYELNVRFGSTLLEICKPSGFKYSSRLQTFGLAAFQKDILRYKKQGSSEITAFRADNVAPFHSDEFYFEITVSNCGMACNITVGFCHHCHFKQDMQPGNYPQSCGYDGATGKLFTSSETGQEFGPKLSEGDTVGAGISFKSNTICFVKNGNVIGSIPNEIMSFAVYPVVSLGSVAEEVNFNFGKQPFKCMSPFNASK